MFLFVRIPSSVLHEPSPHLTHTGKETTDNIPYIFSGRGCKEENKTRTTSISLDIFSPCSLLCTPYSQLLRLCLDNQYTPVRLRTSSWTYLTSTFPLRSSNKTKTNTTKTHNKINTSRINLTILSVSPTVANPRPTSSTPKAEATSTQIPPPSPKNETRPRRNVFYTF